MAVKEKELIVSLHADINIAHGKKKSSGGHAVRVVDPDDRMTESFRSSINSAILSKQQRGLPVARYDAESKRAYLEFSDGRRQYVD